MCSVKRISKNIEVGLKDYPRVNCAIAPELESELIKLMQETHQQLIINLEGVRFIDTVGFNTLNKVKAIDGQKEVIIKNACEDVRELFALLKLDSQYTFCEN
jgi:anti-anti-sigma regulatory factor